MPDILDTIDAVHEQALESASKAAKDWLDKNGDRDCCGFAWVTVYKVRSNSKLGKKLQTFGFDKAYGGGLQLWNPGRASTQSLTPKENACQAYVKVMREAFPEIEIYAGSRMD